MTEKTPIAILISGRGSNMAALIDACADASFPASVALVFSDKADAPGLALAKEQGIATQTLARGGFDSREDYDDAVADIVAASGAELVCFAGYMRLVTPAFIGCWPDRILNIHPSLLPAFKGMDAQKQAIDAGVKIAGCTVHIVREDMDAGPIIIQRAVEVEENDTPETLATRISEQEHSAYMEALWLMCAGMVTIDGDVAHVAYE